MIDTECKSHGFYHLQISTYVGTVMDAPYLLHAQLGHLSLAKMQQLFQVCLSYPVCLWGCHLGKHNHVSFSSSVSHMLCPLLP